MKYRHDCVNRKDEARSHLLKPVVGIYEFDEQGLHMQ